MDYLGHVVSESKPTKHRETEQVAAKEGTVSKEEQRKHRAAERAQTNVRLKPLQKKLSTCEEKVAALEARLKEITHTMAHPKRVDGKTDWESVAGLGKEKKQIEMDLAHLEVEWEQLQKEIERIISS
jgi:chromosome segregation ATPase